MPSWFSTSYLQSIFEYETDYFLHFEITCIREEVYICGILIKFTIDHNIRGERRPKIHTSAGPSPAMAPTPYDHDLDSTILRRSITNVNHTQAVTLGIIALYVVVIALLWNLPYIRWSLWPFKVCLLPSLHDVC